MTTRNKTKYIFTDNLLKCERTYCIIIECIQFSINCLSAVVFKLFVIADPFHCTQTAADTFVLSTLFRLLKN